METKCHTRKLVNGETFFVCGSCGYEGKLSEEYKLPDPKPYVVMRGSIIAICPECKERRILL